MGMREDCRQYESRSFKNGERTSRCRLGLAPDAPLRCPTGCESYDKTHHDLNWTYGTLGPKPETTDPMLSSDGEVDAILQDAKEVIDQAETKIKAENGSKRFSARKRTRKVANPKNKDQQRQKNPRGKKRSNNE